MESMRLVGVDVRAKESVVAVLDQATGDVSTHRIAGRLDDAGHGGPAFSRGV
jgi:hypothetical protein